MYQFYKCPFSSGKKKKSKLSKWPSSVFLCGRSSIWRNLCRPCSCCLTYSVVIHLCHITPGLVDAACCSSFIQSVLRGWVCVDLGRSPGCLLLHWDRSRSPQTQFEIIKRLLVEMCDHTQDTGVHSFSQKLQASLNSFQFSNLLLFGNTPTSILPSVRRNVSHLLCLLCLRAAAPSLCPSNVSLGSQVNQSLVFHLLPNLSLIWTPTGDAAFSV